MEKKQYYSTKEYAEIFLYSDERPVIRLIKKGKLRAIRRLGDKRWLIPARYVKLGSEQ